jgi:hypothetical protein
MAHQNITLGYGTLTADGFIQHLEYRGLRLPVKLESRGRSVLRADTSSRHPLPARTEDGAYLFVLPGGATIAAKVWPVRA